MSGINEYMTMIEEETKAADKTKEINKETPKKKGRKKHNISFKYLISGNVHYSNDNKILQALEARRAEVAAVGASVVVRVGHVRFEFRERHFRLFDAQIALYVAPVFLFLVISVAAASVPRPPRLHRALRVLRRARRHRRERHDRDAVRTVCIKRLSQADLFE